MRWFLGGMVVVCLMGVWAYAAEPRPDAELGDFMHVKLLHAQGVLEGLVIEDYDLVAKHSQEISLLSQEAGWRVIQTDEYAVQSEEFRRAVDALTEAARERNLDEATLRYVAVTMKCIECHKYSRGQQLLRRAPMDVSR